MHILIVSCVYPPEPVVSSQTSAQIAQSLSRSGHRVTVLTAFPSRPGGELYTGYIRHLFVSEKQGAVQLRRCFSFISSKSQLLSRFLENVSFGLTSGLAAFIVDRPDVIYSNTWPIFATGFIALVAHLRKIPLVVNVQDIYPESLIIQQRIRPNSLIARLLGKIDRAISIRCHDVIVISDSFAAIYRDQRGLPDERVHVIPNWVDSNVMDDDKSAGSDFRSRYSIPADQFTMVYGGNIGAAAGVETVIRSLDKMQNAEHLCLVIAGAGSHLAACQQLISQVRHGRIVIHTPWPKEETAMVLKAANVLVLPTSGNQSLASVPSKLITYMLAARPIIALALPQSETARVIRDAKCGWVVPPDCPDLLAQRIEQAMKTSSQEMVSRGKSGREYALQHFTAKTCLPRVINVLMKSAVKL